MSNAAPAGEQPAMDMFVFTRFGVGVTDPVWLSTRLKLFEAITAPSLLAQTDQRFHWSLYLGTEPLDWVAARLREICEPFGDRVELVSAPRNYSEMRGTVMRNRKAPRMLTAVIDDDDAWHVETVARAMRCAADILAEGVEKFGFTFPRGYEWLITDLIDVDKLNRGERIIRKAAAYPYERPYLGTSCFTFSRHEDCFEKIGGLHASVGELLRDAGFDSRIVEQDWPAWLYVRHQQADSAIRKARTDGVQLPLDDLQRLFGVSAELIQRFRTESSTIPYAAKRTHQRADKSNLTFDLPKAGEFAVGDEKLPQLKVGLSKRPEAGRYVFNPRQEYAILAPECRLAIYDNRAGGFCLLEVIRSDVDTVVREAALPSSECKYKLQVRMNGKWVDDVAYARLMPALPSRSATVGPGRSEPSNASSTSSAHTMSAGGGPHVALAALDVQLLSMSALFDLSSAASRKNSNGALDDLFLRLHSIVRPDVVLELGACDATLSQQVRKRLPQATIIAFEANPHNYEKFKNHRGLADAQIEYLHLAVSDRTGAVPSCVHTGRAGNSSPADTDSNSTLERLRDVEQERIKVPATSIDDFLARRGLVGNLSACINVNGAIKSVLLGMRNRLPDFGLLMCEVEEREHWREQWLWHDVLKFLVAQDFVPVARDFKDTTHHNVIFIRHDLLCRPDIRFTLARHWSALGHPRQEYDQMAT